MSQRHFLFLKAQLQPLGIQGEVIHFHHTLNLFCIGSIRPAQAAPDFGHHHFIVKGFRDVIIRTVFKSHHLIHLSIPGRYEQNGAGGYRADLSTPIETVVFGQIDVHQHQIRGNLFKLLQHL
jgi:hypothetical protein